MFRCGWARTNGTKTLRSSSSDSHRPPLMIHISHPTPTYHLNILGTFASSAHSNLHHLSSVLRGNSFRVVVRLGWSSAQRSSRQVIANLSKTYQVWVVYPTTVDTPSPYLRSPSSTSCYVIHLRLRASTFFLVICANTILFLPGLGVVFPWVV